jgi:CHAD domain-containing protein
MWTLDNDPNRTGESGTPKKSDDAHEPTTSQQDSAQHEARPRHADISSDDDRADHAELVHEARKAIKRMRAFARLLRYELGEKEFDRVNSSLRVTGRHLAGARDAEVRLAILERLRRRHPHALELEGIKRLRERLQRERDEASATLPEQTALQEIGEMRRELARWKLIEHDFKTLEPGLRRIYREGRQRYRQVGRRQVSDVEAAHDWRKRVKSLYYALDMLGGNDAKGVRKSTRCAELLAEALGEEHDLWLLTSYIGDNPDTFAGDDSARIALMTLAERRRKRLRDRALSRGGRLYKRKPRDFTRHVQQALARA